MRLVALRRIVQPELLVFEQVAVVGQERNAVVHLQRAIPLKLEIPDGIERIGVIARLFQLTADFHRLPLRHFVRHGHGFHREGIGLLDVHVIVTRHGGERHGGEQVHTEDLSCISLPQFLQNIKNSPYKIYYKYIREFFTMLQI